MPINALQDLTFDSGTTASIVCGALRCPFTKFSPGKITVKRAKVRPIGNAIATKRTPGSAEIGDWNAEIMASDFEGTLLPRMPKHGGSLVEFGALIKLAHPSIAGTLAVWLSETTMVEWDGPELDGEAAEKALIYKIQFSSMGRFDKGRDGVWKCLFYDPRRPSADAVPPIPF